MAALRLEYLGNKVNQYDITMAGIEYVEDMLAASLAKTAKR
jgi:hypothetical protein